MKTKSALGLAACFLMFVAGCNSSPESLIVGKWEAGQGALKAEFRKDGKATLTMPIGKPMTGTYKLNGDEMEWNMGGTIAKFKVKVSETEMELSGNGNQAVKYKRV